MRELTMQEMEQVSGGFFVPGAVAGCIAGAVTHDNGATGSVMGCAGGTAASLALAMTAFAGPIGVVALVGVSVGIAYTTYQAQEYLNNKTPSPVPSGS